MKGEERAREEARNKLILKMSDLNMVYPIVVHA